MGFMEYLKACQIRNNKLRHFLVNYSVTTLNKENER